MRWKLKSRCSIQVFQIWEWTLGNRKQREVQGDGVKIENGVPLWGQDCIYTLITLRNTLTHTHTHTELHLQIQETHMGGHVHTFDLHVHTHSDTESERPLRLNATRRRSIAKPEPQYCSPSWLSNTHMHAHTHTHSSLSSYLRSMAVRCVHGYRASTPVPNGDHETLGISVWLIDRLLQRHTHHIASVCVCVCVGQREGIYIFSSLSSSACVSASPCGLSAHRLPISFFHLVHCNAFRRTYGGKEKRRSDKGGVKKQGVQSRSQ